MSKIGWWLAIIFVPLVTAITFLFSYQYEKEADMRRFGAFADLVPSAYFNPALNALPSTIASALAAVLIVLIIAVVFRLRRQIK